MGKGGVENGQNCPYVIYERPLRHLESRVNVGTYFIMSYRKYVSELKPRWHDPASHPEVKVAGIRQTCDDSCSLGDVSSCLLVDKFK